MKYEVPRLARLPISTDEQEALEICDSFMSFLGRIELRSQEACELAADYLEYHMRQDEEEPVKTLAPQIAQFLRSQKDMKEKEDI